MTERNEAEDDQVVRKASASYPLETATAIAEDMPQGYRRTEEGVIPEDWETKRFGEVLARKNLKSYQIHTIDYRNSGNYPVVDQGQELIIGFTDRKDKVFNCPAEGVIVFGDHTCIVKFVDFDFAVGADGTQILESRDGQCTRFYAYHLELKGVQSTGYNRHFKFLKEKIFAIPGKGEQTTIATALSDADALIESLDRLIAKKRAIKLAAMQQLLTGQTRLPGFTGEWETKRLGEIADIRSGGTPSTAMAAFWNGVVPWCTPTEITALRGCKYLSETERTISHAGLQASSAESIPPRSIIMTTRATIGECAINTVPMTTNQGFKNLVPFNADPEFLYYLMTTKKSQLVQLCGGSTFLEIGKKQLHGFELMLPPSHEEHEAIATVLSDMDAETEALEHRREKARQIKQGMMQQLLTGRVRLI